MVIAWAPHWEKKEKKIGVVEKKKIGEPSEPRGILAEGERSARSDGRYIFFLIWSCFLPFSPTAESGLRPYCYDWLQTWRNKKKKLESSEAYLLKLGSWAFEVIYIFYKNTVWNLICQWPVFDYYVILLGYLFLQITWKSKTTECIMVVIFIKTKLFFKRFCFSSPFYQSLHLVPEVFFWRALGCIG